MLNAYMTDTVKLHRAASYDRYNQPLPDAEIVLRARVEIGTKLVRDIKGENVYASMSVILKTRAIGHDDFIEYGGIEYAIVSISKPRDFSWGYMEVFLK
jgi:hypothetical protein